MRLFLCRAGGGHPDDRVRFGGNSLFALYNARRSGEGRRTGSGRDIMQGIMLPDESIRARLEGQAEAELLASRAAGVSRAERVRHLDRAAVYATRAEEEGRITAEEKGRPGSTGD